MKCIVYISSAIAEFSTIELHDLIQLAAIKNKRLGVTGFLCFSRGRFLQYIEGDDEVIQNLMITINNDSRHDVMFELEAKTIESRLFSSWSMRLMSAKEIAKFNFELLIEQNLLYIKNDFWFKERCEKSIWEHIIQMSKLKKYLDIYSDGQDEPGIKSLR